MIFFIMRQWAWRYRRRLTLVIVLVLALTAVGISHVIGSGSHPDKIVLPATLLGQSRDTGPEGQALSGQVRNNVIIGNKGDVASVVSALYGSTPLDSWFVVAGGQECGTCTPKPASQVVRDYIAAGATDARSFPPGSAGGILVCSSTQISLLPAIQCLWADAGTSGLALFSPGVRRNPCRSRHVDEPDPRPVER
jgi:hypothetical protein